MLLVALLAARTFPPSPASGNRRETG
jgi:hypothetical protein